MPGTSLMDTQNATSSSPGGMPSVSSNHRVLWNLCRYHEFPCGSRGMPVMNGLKVIQKKWDELKAYILALHVSVD